MAVIDASDLIASFSTPVAFVQKSQTRQISAMNSIDVHLNTYRTFLATDDGNVSGIDHVKRKLAAYQ